MCHSVYLHILLGIAAYKIFIPGGFLKIKNETKNRENE